ncbi:unnamed protein product [Heligmosomoides polygyrus]|uniref:Uncharacterized protein n=1 Tax=Heligmosomoides polygyrus TaxID=6339 RepID=A0A183GMR0_HELPZ|nr:unnamed protein product [Heligmosomoides polygyrus]
MLISKPDVKGKIHKKEVMSVCLSVSGVIYWELLQDDVTVTADIYVLHLERIKAVLDRRPEQPKKKIYKTTFARMLPSRRAGNWWD